MRANRVSKLVKYPYVYLTNFRFSRSRRHTIGRYSARESKLKIRNKISSFNVPFWSKIDFEYDCLNAFVATYTFQIRFPPKWNSIRKTFILRFQPIFACRMIRRLCTSLDLRIRQNAYPSSMESRCFRKCSLQRDFVTLDFRLTSSRRKSLSRFTRAINFRSRSVQQIIISLQVFRSVLYLTSVTVVSYDANEISTSFIERVKHGHENFLR